jgi:plastocyanin
VIAKILACACVLVLVGCDRAPPGPEASPESPTPAEEIETSPPPEEELTGCEDLSAAQAGPAGIVMENNEFVPECFAVSSTQRLQLINSGTVIHNFSIEDEVDIDVQPGKRTNTDPLEDLVTPATYNFFCKYHAEMRGTMIVE